MNKLSAESARKELTKLKVWENDGVLTLKEERYLQALEIALPILEQQERGEGEWIKCSDRLPPSRTGVLVGCTFGKEWAMKWATRIHGHPDASPEGWLIPGASWVPTHWQPLPAPPEDV